MVFLLSSPTAFLLICGGCISACVRATELGINEQLLSVQMDVVEV